MLASSTYISKQPASMVTREMSKESGCNLLGSNPGDCSTPYVSFPLQTFGHESMDCFPSNLRIS